MAASDATLRKAYRKADIRLLAWYSFVFLILRIESHNNTNAAIMNLEEQTDIRHQLGDLTSEQWALVLSIYQYPYILFEPLSTLLLKKCSPRTWMSRIMITWGIISMCKGATQNFGSLLACQCLLGLAEAGFLPGVLYHLSFWYPVDRLSVRIALFYAFGQLSGAFSGLFAYAISYLNGKGGLAAWRYLFILEGIPAVICGIYSLFFLPNYPDDARFLTKTEREKILEHLPETKPDKAWDWQQIKTLFTDVTTYSFLLIWACHAIGTKGVTTVLPTVVYQLGITNTTSAQLMTMPPYVFGSIGLVVIAWLIHWKKLKSWVAASCLEAFACICYIPLITVHSPVAKYVLVLLTTTSSIGVPPDLVARTHSRHFREYQRRSRNRSHKRCGRTARDR